MPVLQPYKIIQIPDAGGTFTLVGTDLYLRYIIEFTQTGTLSGVVSITGDGTGDIQSIYNVEYPGGAVIGGGITITIFGKALSVQQSLTPCQIQARVINLTPPAFTTQIYTDWGTANNVTLAQMTANSVGTTQIVDAAVTLAKTASLARGRIIVGDPTARPAAVNLGGATAGSIPVADGNDVAIVTPSGDWTQNGSGVNVIGAAKISTAKLIDAAVTFAKIQALPRGSGVRGSSANVMEAISLSGAGAGGIFFTDGVDLLAGLMSGDGTLSGAGVLSIIDGLNLYVTKVLISTESVLTGNGTPVALVGATAGKIIRPVVCSETLTYKTTPYATNGVSQLRHDTATDPCMTLGSSFLFGTTTKTAEMSVNPINGVTDTQLLVNKALYWEVGTGNPTAGDSPVTVLLAFQLVDP